jgi:endonuclease/exonuclease/phosphatase (EEP) superfamily protein YafD
MAAKRGTSASVAVGQGLIGFGLVAIGVIATLATLLGFFGSTWWLFDYAANFRPHLAVVLLMVSLAYSLVFSKATGLFFMAMAVVNALVVLPLYAGSPAAAAAGDDMTIVSFNVDQRVSIRPTTYTWIEAVEPDIVVLVNANDDWVRTGATPPSYQYVNDLPLDRTFGISVLAREDLNAEIIRVTQIRDMVVRVEASIAGQPIAVYAVQSRTSSNRGDADLRDDYFEQVALLVRRDSMPAVVVGDFQSGPWSHTIRSLQGDADLVDSLKGFGIQTTYPADRWAFLRLPFDNLLHSEELTTVDRYLGPTFGVAHRPIVVKLALAA